VDYPFFGCPTNAVFTTAIENFDRELLSHLSVKSCSLGNLVLFLSDMTTAVQCQCWLRLGLTTLPQMLASCFQHSSTDTITHTVVISE